MVVQYSEIQELLRSRADLHTRLNLMPYDGRPEIKERGDEGEDIAVIAAFMKERCWKTVES